MALLAANLILPVLHFLPASADTKAAAASAEPATPRDRTPARQSAGVAAAQMAPPPAAIPTELAMLHEPAPVCRAWGPFTELSEAESMAARLRLEGDDFEVFESEVNAAPDYLVTVQAPGQRDAAERMIEELQSLSVESYLLEREPGVSLLAAGVFSARERAASQRRRLRELGYQAQVKPLDRSHPVYHLMARVEPGRELEIPPVGACGDIAPMNQFL